MNPKFSVGEVVLLNSSQYPEYNGEYSVVAIVKHGDIYKNKVVSASDNKNFYYDLGFQTHLFKDFSVWNEAALRKKHQPSEFSFNSLMDNLKLTQKV